MNLYGLIGYPLGHSFSKQYFTKKFEQEGITNAAYELFPIRSMDELKELIEKNPLLSGLNVTIPHKTAVLKYLADLSNIPAGLNACNCIRIVAGKTYGYNTDVMGFEKSIMPRLKTGQNKALILGNGGAAEAVKYVFKKNSIEFNIVSRVHKEGSNLTYDQLNKEIIAAHPVIVNTTPLGMSPAENTCPDIPYEYISKLHHLYDLVYNPEKTVFLQKGEAMGATTQNGYEMLLIQAEESWKIWNNDSSK